MAVHWDDGEVEFVTKRIETDGNEPCSPLRSHCPSRLRWHTTESGEHDGFGPFCYYEFIQRGQVFRRLSLHVDETEVCEKELANG